MLAVPVCLIARLFVPLAILVSIALKSAAAVIVGLTYNQRTIPFAPPVWLIVHEIP